MARSAPDPLPLYGGGVWARDYYTIDKLDITDYVNGIGNCSREQ